MCYPSAPTPASTISGRAYRSVPDTIKRAHHVVITANLSFSAWSAVFTNAKLPTALLDRLTHYPGAGCAALKLHKQDEAPCVLRFFSTAQNRRQGDQAKPAIEFAYAQLLIQKLLTRPSSIFNWRR